MRILDWFRKRKVIDKYGIWKYRNRHKHRKEMTGYMEGGLTAFKSNTVRAGMIVLKLEKRKSGN